MKYYISHNRQGSTEWLNDRSGCFTASAISALITPGLALSESETARQYLRKVRWEKENGMSLDLLFPVQTYAMRMGTEMESVAAVQFEEIGFTSIGFVRQGTQENQGLFGCSPDRVTLHKGRITAGLEIKCPQSVDSFLKMIDCKTAADVRKSFFGYWLQCQLTMYVTGLQDYMLHFYTAIETNTVFIQADSAAFQCFDNLKKKMNL